ncbi:hypothetical protein [Ornithinimicrobium kibberense]|uniref:hypothetical protein n=1 Tax=Ornithinimicrobium kibberense TaxID=282060 RepID=UPI0036093FE5
MPHHWLRAPTDRGVNTLDHAQSRRDSLTGCQGLRGWIRRAGGIGERASGPVPLSLGFW